MRYSTLRLAFAWPRHLGSVVYLVSVGLSQVKYCVFATSLQLLSSHTCTLQHSKTVWYKSHSAILEIRGSSFLLCMPCVISSSKNILQEKLTIRCTYTVRRHLFLQVEVRWGSMLWFALLQLKSKTPFLTFIINSSKWRFISIIGHTCISGPCKERRQISTGTKLPTNPMSCVRTGQKASIQACCLTQCQCQDLPLWLGRSGIVKPLQLLLAPVREPLALQKPGSNTLRLFFIYHHQNYTAIMEESSFLAGTWSTILISRQAGSCTTTLWHLLLSEKTRR